METTEGNLERARDNAWEEEIEGIPEREGLVEGAREGSKYGASLRSSCPARKWVSSLPSSSAGWEGRGGAGMRAVRSGVWLSISQLVDESGGEVYLGYLSRKDVQRAVSDGGYVY